MNFRREEPATALCHGRAKAVLRVRNLVLAGCAASFCAGCATPGPPRAPSLNLPEAASAARAERVGDHVVLTWTSSPNSTDGDRLRGAITAVICRGVPPPPAARRATAAAPAVCNPVQRFAVLPGADRAEERLPPELRAGLVREIFYKIELLNADGRSAGASAPLYVGAGEAPAPAGGLTLVSQKSGALIRWQVERAPAAAGTVMQLTRTLTAAVPASAAATGVKTHSRTGPGSARRGAQAQPAGKPAGSSPAAAVVLETSLAPAAPNASSAGQDPGGMIDPTVLDGGTYSYIAQRVLRVRVAGQDLELRGEPSAAAQLSVRDIFPPAAPVGLVAVPGGGLDAPPAMDLSWDPAAEPDVAGYYVYRAPVLAGRAGAFTRLAASVPASAYRDLTVVPGERYAYRVTAVDRLGNESAPSPVIDEAVPARVKRQ